MKRNIFRMAIAIIAMSFASTQQADAATIIPKVSVHAITKQQPMNVVQIVQPLQLNQMRWWSSTLFPGIVQAMNEVAACTIMGVKYVVGQVHEVVSTMPTPVGLP